MATQKDKDNRSFVESPTRGANQYAREVVIASDYSLSWDDTSTTDVIYLGEALVGSATSSAVWRIKEINTANGSIRYADSDAAFDNIWDDRVGLTYG